MLFLGQGATDLDHPGGVVDAVDAFGLAGQQTRERAVAGAEVGDAYPGRKQEEHLTDRFPRATWAVVTAEAVGHEVEVLLSFLAALLDDPLQGALVRGGLGLAGAGGEGGVHDAGDAHRQVAGERVERFLTVASVVHELGLAQ